MNITKMQAELFCVSCNQETLHDVIYLEESIERISCIECETTLEIDEKLVLSAYTASLFKRINTKPERMNKEIKKDLSKFLCSMPMRVVTKPYRMVKEFKNIKNMMKEK
ncbi:MAG: hypothetical protein K0R93_3309 [Anaerosolibacter sp.]|jgi:hypothetical protein|uniref:bh protein n=1 Tax=Anaerosolibacter sp. TaxID=1872527 RepID=UPI00260A59DB|nr:bh protein [Anaerosolibacter sp.]MDF2548411.1 hypothetical protein [Anaerosolibacter sp.]